MNKLVVFASLPALLVWLTVGACVPEAAIKDLCGDDAFCESAPRCPPEPPNGGVRCDDIVEKLDECFYCTEGDRIDASHYECDDKGRWRRLSNTDCE